MAGRKRFARKRKTKRRRKTGAGNKLMSQLATGGVKSFKLTSTFDLIMSPNTTSGTSTAALYNFSLLNSVTPPGTLPYTLIAPLSIQSFNFDRLCKLYQEFTITGIRVKATFVRDGYEAVLTVPISVEWAYDDMQPISATASAVSLGLSQYANYQQGPIPSSYSTSRYLSTAGLKQRLGIGWCATDDANFTYQGQLPTTTQPSLFLRVYCTTARPSGSPIGQLSVSYYYKFRGLDFGVNP